MDYKDKKVLIIGAGKSGVAVALFLIKKGARVTLADAVCPTGQEGLWARLREAGAELYWGGYPEINQGSFAQLVLSPGVPLTAQPVRFAEKAGIPITGEMELAYQYAKAPIVAITGTNGKTTTTALIGEIFRKSGKTTLVGGNIGLPLVSLVEGADAQVIVAEVSSFQLETTASFKPKVSVILNITPDHLDRHGIMENYTAVKAGILANQQKGDYAILNYDDPLVAPLNKLTAAQPIYFSRLKKPEGGVFLEDGYITDDINGARERVIKARELLIPGSHNLENALAAAAAARVMGASRETLAAALGEFPGVAHRLEYVAEINGVKYINDSKGTNPFATIKALESYDEPIVLIAGGRNKGGDFKEFAAALKDKARVLVTLGESAELIGAAAREVGFSAIQTAADFPAAVQAAAKAARPGEVVLLSPACASWDMFKNFEERGDLFKELVAGMQGRKP